MTLRASALKALLVSLIAGVAVLACVQTNAHAFSYSYCSYAWIASGGQCGDGSYLNRTFNGSAVFTTSKIACEQMVTAAGNVRGGGGLCATTTITQCLNYSTPASQAFVVSYAWNGGTYQFNGWTDDSPNHTQPCY